MGNIKFSAKDTQQYREALRSLSDRLAAGVAGLEAESTRPGPGSNGQEPPAHEADRAVREADEQLARTILVTEGHLLSEVNAAMERLATGTFGLCERCGGAVSRARLDVIPYVRTCVDCAQKVESCDAGDPAHS